MKGDVYVRYKATDGSVQQQFIKQCKFRRMFPWILRRWKPAEDIVWYNVASVPGVVEVQRVIVYTGKNGYFNLPVSILKSPPRRIRLRNNY